MKYHAWLLLIILTLNACTFLLLLTWFITTILCAHSRLFCACLAHTKVQ